MWCADPEALRRVFRLGWPIGITNLSEVGLFAMSTVMMGWLGVYPQAAHVIALQIASATFMFHLGLSNAATVRAGHAHGRQNETELRDGAVAAFGLSAGFVVLTIAAFLLFPEPLIGIFMKPDEAARSEILAIGVVLLALAALFQAVDAAQVMALGLLRGVQDTRVPMIWAAIAYWVIGMPASYYLGFEAGWGGAGVWLGLTFGLLVAAVALMWRFWRVAVHIEPAPATAAS